MGRLPFDVLCSGVFLLQHHARFLVLFLCDASLPVPSPFPETTSERLCIFQIKLQPGDCLHFIFNF